MSELVRNLLFLSRNEQKLVAALDIQGVLTDEVLVDLGYDIQGDPTAVRRLNQAIVTLNHKMPPELQLIRVFQSSEELGLNPLIIFARDLPPEK
jgi:hypothetical protein